jgi:hypothetical protein
MSANGAKQSVPIIFSGFFGIGGFVLFQCIFSYFG